MKANEPIYKGKVRDIYDEGDSLLLVTTNRLTAFDRPIAEIPFKAQVLNQLSVWWFMRTTHIIGNHLIEMPNACAMRVKKCRVFPIEVIVRGYISGTTNTSIWTLYQQGDRTFFETTLPENLHKNAQLPTPILTPTTKAHDHDQPMTVQDIENADYITADEWKVVRTKALELFKFGQETAQKAGLILVDTKYEFGKDEEGNILLVDECHTPDSSRYWLLDTYHAKLEAGQEPDNFDKEMLRLWFRKNCNPYDDEVLPTAPVELVEELSRRYQEIYRRLTGASICRN